MRLGALIVLLLGMSANAADLLSVKVDRVDGTYIMSSEVWFDASIDQMYSTMKNWDLSTKFSSVVVESRNVEPDEDGRPRYYSRNEACIMFFCTSFERNGFVEHVPNELIRATVDPESSDFHFSNEEWRFREEDNGTVVTYDLEFKPKFFVPPLIGPYMIKRKLRSGSRDAIDRIEQVARETYPVEQ